MKAEEQVTFIEIGGTRDPVYKVSECTSNHTHARILAPGKPHIDLTFKTPEDVYDFAQCLLRSYDRAVGIGERRL